MDKYGWICAQQTSIYNVIHRRYSYYNKEINISSCYKILLWIHNFSNKNLGVSEMIFGTSLEDKLHLRNEK